MSVAKTIEISATSPESFHAAAAEGIRKASETVENIQSAWVKEQHVDVNGGNVTDYRVTMKVTFLLKG